MRAKSHYAQEAATIVGKMRAAAVAAAKAKAQQEAEARKAAQAVEVHKSDEDSPTAENHPYDSIGLKRIDSERDRLVGDIPATPDR